MIANKKGQSTVELALVMPLLLLIMVGIMEFGLMFKTSIQLSNGSNELCRAYSLSASNADITSISNAAFTGLNNQRLTVTVTPASPVKGNPITVKVEYQYEWITPLIGTLLGNSVKLYGTAVMIKE